MRDFLKKMLGTDATAPSGRGDTAGDDDVRVAACALFLEMARIDNEFDDVERDEIIAILREQHGLSQEAADQLAEQAASQLDGSIDLWKFTNIINEQCTDEEKLRIVEMLWRIVYADGVLDGHEDYLVHKLAKLLRLQHKQLIATKLRVINSE